jgi:glutaredoxin 3
MAEVVIYSTRSCPYCVRAKDLFKQKNVTFTEIDVSDDDEMRIAMMQKAGGRRTVPQIFIDDTHIGGYDDLYALDSQGKLDPMLVVKG